jgi:ERCC4-type nuclease
MKPVDKKSIVDIFEYLKLMKIDSIPAQSIKNILKDLKTVKDKYNFKEFMDEIMKATGIGKNHWNKCPNGHYYAIGDCGGAM